MHARCVGRATLFVKVTNVALREPVGPWPLVGPGRPVKTDNSGTEIGNLGNLDGSVRRLSRLLQGDEGVAKAIGAQGEFQALPVRECHRGR